MLSRLINLFYPTADDYDVPATDNQAINDQAINQVINNQDINNLTADEIVAEIDRLKEQIKVFELRLIDIQPKPIEVTDINQVKSGSYIVYDAAKTHIIAKGMFMNGRLIKGEQFGYVCNSQFVITTNRDKNSNWAVGTFNSAGLFEGYGETYFGYHKVRLIKKGEFVNGELWKGEFYYSGKWFIGIFIESFLCGKGEIYADYEKTKLIEQGTFLRDNLINGKKWDAKQNKWLVGEFYSDGNLIPNSKIPADSDNSVKHDNLVKHDNVVKHDKSTECNKLTDCKITAVGTLTINKKRVTFTGKQT